MDNHDSHLSIEAIVLAKENEVVFLTFSPHCSRKLQPLNISVYGPLKRYFNDTTNSRHLEHPGETVSIYQIAGLLGKSFPLAMTISNIISGFCKPGISPYGRHDFGNDEFLGAFVTDRPDPTQLSSGAGVLPIMLSNPSDEPRNESNNQPSNQPSCSYSSNDIAISTTTPEQLRPFLKAGPRKTTAGRKRRSTAVLTNTPVKEQLAKEAKEKVERKRKPKKCRVSKVQVLRYLNNVCHSL